MQLLIRRVCCGVIVIGFIAGCGPSVVPPDPEDTTWMLGAWSQYDRGIPAERSSRLELSEDGSLRETVEQCGSAAPPVITEYTWQSIEGDRVIEVMDPDGTPMNDYEEPTYLVFAPACEQFNAHEAVYLVHDPEGDVLDVSISSWNSGALCMGPRSESGECAMVRCGQPPTKCPSSTRG